MEWNVPLLGHVQHVCFRRNSAQCKNHTKLRKLNKNVTVLNIYVYISVQPNVVYSVSLIWIRHCLKHVHSTTEFSFWLRKICMNCHMLLHMIMCTLRNRATSFYVSLILHFDTLRWKQTFHFTMFQFALYVIIAVSPLVDTNKVKNPESTKLRKWHLPDRKARPSMRNRILLWWVTAATVEIISSQFVARFTVANI